MATCDFFISYTRSDAEWAEWIAWQLESAGNRVVIQAWDFLPGENFVLEMDRALRDASTIIAVLSPDYLESGFASAEWSAGFAKDPRGGAARLVPVRVKHCQPDGLLAQIIYVDLVGLTKPEASKTLLDGVVAARQKPISAPGFPGGEPRDVSHGNSVATRELLVDIIQGSIRQRGQGVLATAESLHAPSPTLELILANSARSLGVELLIPRISMDVSSVSATGCTFPNDETTGAMIPRYEFSVDLRLAETLDNILPSPIHLVQGEKIDLMFGLSGQAETLYTVTNPPAPGPPS
jgi:hypothetical protein